MEDNFENDIFNIISLPNKVSGIKEDLPFFLVTDKVKKIFNKRFSRALRTIKNTFTFLAARWRIFRQQIKVNVGMV